MSQNQRRSGLWTTAQPLLGSLVVFLTVPIGIGPVAGGWLAGRGVRGLGRRTLASTVAGVLGVLPWTVVSFLAMRGAIEPIGYHEGMVHVGVLTASPGALVPWQEVGLSAVLTGTVVAFAVAGGAGAGLLREETLSRQGKL